MNNIFVSYEVASELKELGFDESCFGYYDCERDFKFLPDKSKFLECELAAPTFSHVFRFFREKYNIQGYIYSSTVRGNAQKTKQFTGYIWNINGIDMPFLSTDARDELHDTYEEAELACLIKLIELIKNENNE